MLEQRILDLLSDGRGMTLYQVFGALPQGGNMSTVDVARALKRLVKRGHLTVEDDVYEIAAPRMEDPELAAALAQAVKHIEAAREGYAAWGSLADEGILGSLDAARDSARRALLRYYGELL